MPQNKLSCNIWDESNWSWGTQEIDRECVRWQTKMKNKNLNQNNDLQIWLGFSIEEIKEMFCTILNDFHENWSFWKRILAFKAQMSAVWKTYLGKCMDYSLCYCSVDSAFSPFIELSVFLLFWSLESQSQASSISCI